MKNPWIIGGVVIVALIGLAVWYANSVSATYNVGVEVKTHVKGNPDAAVVLVEYSDFQCPACAQFQPVVDEIVATYGDQLRFEYRHFPLLQIHPFAEPAARAAEAAGQQGKFFEFHDLLFINQTTWSQSGNPMPFFLQYAEELGLDMEQFTRQMRSSVLRDQVRAQFNEAREYGFTGTPSFLLNGQRMTFSTFEEFENQIRTAINPAVDFTLPGDTTTTEPLGTTTDTTATPTASVEFGI